MKITIDNLGVVRHIEFDTQKPLSLFCGPNSTGKTYVSYVLYSIMVNETILYQPSSDFKMLCNSILESDGIINLTREIISQIFSELRSYFSTRIQKKILGDIFGISDEIVETRFKDVTVGLEFTDYDYEYIQEFDIENKFCSKHKGSTILTIKNISVTRNYRDVVSRVLLYLFWNFAPTMLTVERNSIYTFKTELSISRNELVDKLVELSSKKNDNVSNLLLSSARRYPMAIRDGLKVANDLDNIKKIRGEYYDFAINLENTLLHGKVEVSSTGEVEFIVGENINLPIQMSSSIVKTLSSLIIYLKYIVKNGDTLIIDEPEMNLHPDNQILLARVFAQMVNMGIKLVISTHSDYIIREFNNLIMLSSVPDNEMQSFLKMGYDKSMILKNKDVAAYMFNFDKENLVTVDNLDVTETGFEVSTIDAAINSINEASEELYYSLKSRQNETEYRNDK